jgi:preprotein translocase subunit SecD
MKKLFILIIFTIFATAISFSQNKLKDGLYLVNRIDTIAGQTSELSVNETDVYFSKMFEDYNTDEFARIIIDTTQYVPLELESAPKTEQQTEDKKKLLLTLTKEASQRLESFTTEHLMKMVTLVVGGEALTLHKIKMAITGGQLQITRCNDNACETLFVKLKENVVK